MAKFHFYNSAEILLQHLKPERPNDDSAAKMNGLALFSGFCQAKREYFGTLVVSKFFSVFLFVLALTKSLKIGVEMIEKVFKEKSSFREKICERK